jgi:hypothetical protein
MMLVSGGFANENFVQLSVLRMKELDLTLHIPCKSSRHGVVTSHQEE